MKQGKHFFLHAIEQLLVQETLETWDFLRKSLTEVQKIFFVKYEIKIKPCMGHLLLRGKNKRMVEGLAGLGIRSFQKIVPIFAFFSVLYKRTFRS